MRGRIVFTPQGHQCQPPSGRWLRRRWPSGTVWECGCGTQWMRVVQQHDGRWMHVWRPAQPDEYVED